MIARVLLLIGLITFCPMAFSQTATESEISRINQLEHQMEVVEQLNTKILNTIYFAVGGALTIMLAVVGLNFFQNFQLNKRKLESMSEEFGAEIRTRFEEWSKVADSSFDQIKTDLSKESSETNEELSESLRSSLNSQNQKIKNLLEQVEDLQREVFIASAFKYKQANTMGYILNLIDVLRLDIKRNWDFRIHESLGLISRCLDDFSPNQESLSKLHVELDKLPPHFEIQKNGIKSKMKFD